MSDCSSTKEKDIQNLRDAGCDETIIQHYLQAMEAGNQEEAVNLLEHHRNQLLEQFHRCSNCIDCLDFFMLHFGSGR